MSLKQITEGYGYGIIQNCFGLLRVLEKEGISHNDFLNFVEKSKKEKLVPVKVRIVTKKVEKQKVENKKFLRFGEIELMEGVQCEKCRGKIYIEAICPSNPLVKKGYVRRGICGDCGVEFGIR